jgi:hypothetical protein
MLDIQMLQLVEPHSQLSRGISEPDRLEESSRSGNRWSPRDWSVNTKPKVDSTLMFVHRRLADGDLYLVDNRSGHPENLDATFRVDGKAPEFWDAATGVSEPASYRIADGRTTLPLHFDPWGTVFVVFRKRATSSSMQLPAVAETELTSAESELNRDWNVTFPPDLGGPVNVTTSSQNFNAPQGIKCGRLASWTENTNTGVQYFSGTATYLRTIQILASDLKPGEHLWLDLGEVKDAAEVSVNGKDFGVLWKTSYRVDVTPALRPGNNAFRIKVTNLW